MRGREGEQMRSNVLCRFCFYLLIPPPLLKVFTYCGSQHIVFESQSGTRGASSLNIFFAVIAPAQMYMYGLGFPTGGAQEHSKKL